MVTIIIRSFTYDVESHNILSRGKTIRVENLTPQLTGEEFIEQRRCIEDNLFDIFSKYNNSNSYLGAAAV